MRWLHAMIASRRGTLLPSTRLPTRAPPRCSGKVTSLRLNCAHETSAGDGITLAIAYNRTKLEHIPRLARRCGEHFVPSP
jgi:hypothetical protein